MRAMPQFTDALVRVGRMELRVATATEEGSSMLDLWWKSGRTTGGAARSAPPTVARRSASADSDAGISALSNTRGAVRSAPSASRAISVTSMETSGIG